MTNPIPTSEAAAEVLRAATEPLTLTEIVRRIGLERRPGGPKPEMKVRSAIYENRFVTTLGGRPARYVWWPNHLQGCSFRQPLAEKDYATGELLTVPEVEVALRPDSQVNRLGAETITIEMEGGPTLTAGIEDLGVSWPIWGPDGQSMVTEWWRSQGASPEDDLILRVRDVQARRYALSLERATDRDAEALRERDGWLLELAAEVLQISRPQALIHTELIPRLIGRGAYRFPLPPSPLARLLRSDLRFVISRYCQAALTIKLVQWAEAEFGPSPDPTARRRPRGDWLAPKSDKGRRAWGEYLFDRGMDYYWDGQDFIAEGYYRAALMTDPGHADAWVHLGIIRFEEGLLDEALQAYRRAEVAAMERTIGDPTTYQRPFWGDLDSRPYMRALHGKGLTLWRLGRRTEAAAVFRQQLELNPNDNQGVRFLLPHLRAGLSWEESQKRLEESGL